MTPDELRQWLAITQLPGLGNSLLRTLDALLAAHGRGRTLTRLDCLAAGFTPTLWESLCRILANDFDDEVRRMQDGCLRWAAAPGHHLLALASPAYPPLLKETGEPPPLLFVAGEPALLAEPQIAMVGTRKPSAEGRRNARRFATELVAAGYVITSGLALGIDAESHAGALDAGGRTIAVLGTGMNVLYPARNRELAARIAASGALVSEFLPDVGPQPWHFPQRNRIISGLSRGVIVVEAAQQSGSLITARWAGEQGREVFAIPGSIHNTLARGCHQLIRQGAKLVEGPGDVFDELPPPGARPAAALVSSAPPELEATARRVLAAIAYDPVPADVLARSTGLDVAVLNAFLVALELQGLIIADAGGYVLSPP